MWFEFENKVVHTAKVGVTTLQLKNNTKINLTKYQNVSKLHFRFKGEKKLKMDGRYSCEHTEDGIVKFSIKDAKENDKGTYRY